MRIFLDLWRPIAISTLLSTRYLPTARSTVGLLQANSGMDSPTIKSQGNTMAFVFGSLSTVARTQSVSHSVCLGHGYLNGLETAELSKVHDGAHTQARPTYLNYKAGYKRAVTSAEYSSSAV